METGLCNCTISNTQMPPAMQPWNSSRLQRTTRFRKVYSQTLEKRSSDPPNPPAGLEVFVLGGVGLETGAALAQPPKSSSAATVGAGFAAGVGAPHPFPRSLGVRVSGTFIVEAMDGAAAAGDGARSGVLHALPPQGSRLPDIMLAVAALAAVVAGALGGCNGGLEILNADFISCWGEVAVDFGGDTVEAETGGEESPNRSFDRDDDGGFGLAVGGGEANPPNPQSCPVEEIDVVRD